VANFSVKYSDRQNLTVIGMKVDFLTCPSETRTEKFDPRYGVGNYSTNQGTWFVWGGYASPYRNSGLFGINFGRKIADINDGTSGTVAMSEGKTWTPNLRNCTISGLDPNVIPSPQEIKSLIANSYGSCNPNRDPGKTRWANSNSYYSGLTFALPPNPKSVAGPNNLEFDLITVDENDGSPTYAATSARSFHPGGVNLLFADGSVKFVKDAIDGLTWRRLGTVAGGEAVSADQY
jgi:prepilin-type processing-associated H-X9-DG protein